MIEVKLYLNRKPEAMLPVRGYHHGDQVEEVHKFAAVGRTETDEQACERMWHACQAIDNPTPYGGRSACVGDVVAVDDRFYACQSLGWARIRPPVSSVTEAR